MRSVALFFALLCALPVAAKRRTFLQSNLQRDRQRIASRGDGPLCEILAPNGTGQALQVFINDDNSRDVVFADDGLTEQTKVQCQGAVPAACVAANGTNGANSCDKFSCACDRRGQVEFAYVKRIMKQLVPACTSPPGNDYRVLVVGLGGGDLPTSILAQCPNNTSVETIEYDQRFLEAATRFFGFQLIEGRNEVHIGEGGEGVRERVASGQRYDAVIVDAFGAGFTVPESCADEDFVTNSKALLRNGGFVMQNIVSPQYQKVIKLYQKVFGDDNVDGQDVQMHFSHLITAELPMKTALGPL